MSEYASSWTNDKVAEFQAFDMNGDGIITVRECLAAVKNGARAGSSSSSSPSSTASTSGSSSNSVPSSSAKPRRVQASAAAPNCVQPEEHRLGKASAEKYDKNKDGRLTPDEWQSMIVKPGRLPMRTATACVTLEEYAAHRSKR
ncbi:MAG: EF-hand domain-containing protein [Pirellulales bacterium]